MANLRDLVGSALTVTIRYEKETRVDSSFSTAPARNRFSPRLPNRTPDKLKGWRFFSWQSIEDQFKIQALTAKTFREMHLSKRSASAARILCVKEQQSRWHCLSSSNQRGANSVTVGPWITKSLPRSTQNPSKHSNSPFRTTETTIYNNWEVGVPFDVAVRLIHWLRVYM